MNARNERIVQRVEEIVAERDLLLAAWEHKDDPVWVGASSIAMLTAACRQSTEPTHRPLDWTGYWRCEAMYERSPAHLRRRMIPMLTQFRDRIVRPTRSVGSEGRA